MMDLSGRAAIVTGGTQGLGLEIVKTLKKDGAAVLIDRYRRECDTIGRRVRIIQDEETICGKAVDVTREGALVAETDTGMRSFTAADVQHLRLAKEE